jgi:hypothetical protein
MTLPRRRARLQARDQVTTLLLPQVLLRVQGPRCLQPAMTLLLLLDLPRRRDLRLMILPHHPDLPRYLPADPGMTSLLLRDRLRSGDKLVVMTSLLLPDRLPATGSQTALTLPLRRALLRLTTT